MEELRQFVFSAMLTEDSLAQLSKIGISVCGPKTVAPVISPEDLGFSPRVLHDASRMSAVFAAFFCIENSARDLITERLLVRKGADWWNVGVPLKIRQSVERLKEKESKNRYHTPRASSLIGYTLFGNLAQIVVANWDEFSDIFPDQAWVTSRFNDLEMSRNIIMHTGTLPQLEIERIESIARDWMRQVG